MALTGAGNIDRSKQNAWKIKKHQIYPKMKNALTLLGLFSGVMFVSYGSVNYPTLWYMIIVGLLISPISMILIDIRELPPKYTMIAVEGEEDDFDEDEEDRPNLIKKYILYTISTLGLGLHIGAWLTLVVSEGPNFWFLYILGVILSLISRYNLFKHKILAILEDYLLYVNPYIGVFLMIAGMHLFTSNMVLSLFMVLAGFFWAPFMLLIRESYMFKVFVMEKWRKYLSVASLTLGISCFLFGLTLIPGDYLISFVFVLEGLIMIVAAVVVSNFNKIVNFQDIL